MGSGDKLLKNTELLTLLKEKTGITDKEGIEKLLNDKEELEK